MSSSSKESYAIIAVLGALAVICGLGGLWLSAQGKTVPESFGNVVAVIVGILGNALTTKRPQDQPQAPQDVTVTNHPGKPVEVDEADPKV